MKLVKPAPVEDDCRQVFSCCKMALRLPKQQKIGQ